MTKGLPESAAVQESEAGVRAVLKRVLRGVVVNRGLVGAMLLASMFEVLLHKGPLLLIKPILDAFTGQTPSVGEAGAGGPGAGAAAADPQDASAAVPQDEGTLGLGNLVSGWSERFQVEFQRFAAWFTDQLGFEFAGGNESMRVILTASFVMMAVAPLGAVAIYFASVLSRFFAAKIVVDLRNELAEHLLHLPLRYYGRERMGELLSRMTNDTTVLARSFSLVADNLVLDALHILGVLAIVGFYSPWLLLFVVPAVPIMGLPMIKIGKKVQKRSRGSLAAMGDSTESMNQMLSGIKVVKAFQLEEARREDFGNANQEYLNRTRRMLEAKGRSQASVFIAYQIGFGMMVLGLSLLLQEPGFTIGTVGQVIAPTSLLYTHIKRVARAYNAMMESAGAMDRINSILDEQPDFSADRSSFQLERVDGRVRLSGVEFAYRDEPVLCGVDLEVEPGQTVAFVGPSGAGKSTCLDLIARFHDPVRGSIEIDGHDLRDVDLGSYRKHTALVSQQPFLFNDTIYANIICARPDASAEDVERAAEAAQIHGFIQDLPDGYQTLCGERGGNLSGGQMQRITIARALLRDPKVLFLDEATSALDSESEEAVQQALNHLMKGRTSFVIAHRLSSVRNADLICVFDQGRIVERGTHDQLSKRGGLYARLIELQELS